MAHHRCAVLLRAERGNLDTRIVSCPCQHGLSDAVDGLCGECHSSLVSAWRSLQPDQAGRHGGDYSGRDYYFAGVNTILEKYLPQRTQRSQSKFRHNAYPSVFSVTSVA